jgi:hypothetical protein
MNTPIIENYRVRNTDDPILLSVTIGFAQRGVTRMLLNGNKHGDGIVDSFTDRVIGTGKNLLGKKLLCTVTVDASQSASSTGPYETSVDFELKGGLKAVEYGREETVTKQGTVVYYIAIFYFLAPIQPLSAPSRPVTS